MSKSAAYPIPADDERRVQALHDLKILDTVDEERFDSLISDLSKTLDAPIAYLALIDAERQWLKAKAGPLAREVEREHAFCSHVIMGNEPVVVADASQDPRFAASPLTQDPGVRFYAGVPISDSATGQVIGTVCIADRRQRELTPRELAILEGFAGRVADEVNALPMAFIAYAAQDLDWVERLVGHGAAMAKRKLFDLWSDLRVSSGEDRGWKLKDALQRSQSVLLLLSEAFLASDFVRQDAFRSLLTARRVEGVEITPILLEPCDWSGIEWLEETPPLAMNGGGIAAAEQTQIDEFFAQLAARVEATLKDKGRVLMPLAEPAEDVSAAPAKTPSATGPKLFLSHASEDAEAVTALAAKLKRAGLDVWLDIDELKPGDSWMTALEDALHSSDAFAVYISGVGVERWIDREVRVALDRNVKDPEFRVIPILGPGADPAKLPSFLSQHHWLDLRNEDSDPARIKKLVGAILDRPAEVVSLLAPGETPFRGLLAFDVAHAHLFFGRDRETEELLEKLQSAPFLAVIGESGSGKSSLVRAGLIPALRRAQLGDGGQQTWRTVTMRPGKDPFRELANALPDLLVDPEPAQRMGVREVCAKQLAGGNDGLCACVGGLVPPGQRTLLVIDQFEEVFTLSEDAAERDRFIDTLLTGSDATGDRPVHVLVTLRADFFSHCFAHPKLPEIISGNQYPARAIARKQLVEVIEKPAAMAGVKLEPGLVEAILHDVGEESATLALLQHTLLQLWKMREGGTLTHESYESIGRVQGALEHHAEDVFGALDAEQQKQAQKLMLRLAVPGKSGTVTRRQTARDELIPEGAAGEAAERVLQHLVDQRLLTVGQGADEGNGGKDEVEVAHEALLRGWTRFRTWLDEDREFLLWRQRTRVVYEAWEEAERDPGALLRGGPLAEARRWLEARGEDFSEAGRAFVTESVARAERALWLKRGVMATIVALAVAAGIFGLVAWRQKLQVVESFEVATMALHQVGEMTEVTGRAQAEQPEAVELKRGIAERAIAFYETVRSQRSFAADLALEEGVARYRLGNLLAIQRDAGASEAAVAAYDSAIAMLGEVAAREPGNPRFRQELANAHYWRGDGRLKSGEAEAAEEDFAEALAAQRELAQSGSPELPRHRRLFELGRTLNGMGIAVRRQARWTEAEATFGEARQSFEDALAEAEPAAGSELGNSYQQGLAWAATNLAELYEGWGNDQRANGQDAAALETLGKAVPEYESAIAILQPLESQNREMTFDLALSYNNLGNVLMHLDRWEDANSANARAVALMEKLAAPIPGIRNELGNTYLSRGEVTWGLERDDEAREIYRKARDIYDGLAQDLQGEELPQYRWRRALALAGLADLGDRGAGGELCRLLPDLSAGQRETFSGYCS